MIKRLKYGNTNTFFIKGISGNLLIDTDYAGTLPMFYKAIKEQDIKVKDIDFIIATHYHPDHIGLVSELTKQGVKLVLIDTQCPFVNFSNKIFARERFLNYTPITMDNAIIITTQESRQFLKGLGIDGEIVNTTSHSEDSVSIILDNGECFVGDLEPMEYLVGFDNEKLKNDWDLIMSYNPKFINFSHQNKKIL